MNGQGYLKYDSEANRSILGYILLFTYILSTYIAQPPIMSSKFNSLFLYLMIGFTLLKIISELGGLNIRSYTYWYLGLILYSIMTYLYSEDSGVVLESSYQLVVVIIITFVITYYLNDTEDFPIIINYFAFSGIILSAFLLNMGLISYDLRFREDIFGNANAFALIITISEICLVWLFFYGNKKLKWIYAPIACLMFYFLLLSGGRKFIIVSLLFVYIIIILKYYKAQKKKLVLFTLLFLLILVGVYFAVFQFKPIYNVVGYRFEGLMNAITGRGKIDLSTLRRERMIEFGLAAFKDKPLFGHGLDNYKVLYFMKSGIYDYAHNNYIELLVDFGIIGFSLYYGYFVYLIYQLRRIKNDPSGLKDFFMGLLLILLVNDYGAVTYNLIQIQILLAMAGSYVWIKRKREIAE